MNRQIKFRVWFPGINLMGSVTNLKGSNDGFLFDGVVAECWPNGKQQFYEAYKNFILMQYTGLKDRLGKEIFDGDILSSSSKYKWIVSWNDDHACFQVKSDNTVVEIIDNANMEVIGNIYENQELLNSA